MISYHRDSLALYKVLRKLHTMYISVGRWLPLQPLSGNSAEISEPITQKLFNVEQ